MSNLSTTITERRDPTVAASKRTAGRCLVVHNDLELRLRLAALVRRAIPKLDADCVSCASFDALGPDFVLSGAAMSEAAESGRPRALAELAKDDVHRSKLAPIALSSTAVLGGRFERDRFGLRSRYPGSPVRALRLASLARLHARRQT